MDGGRHRSSQPVAQVVEGVEDNGEFPGEFGTIFESPFEEIDGEFSDLLGFDVRPADRSWRDRLPVVVDQHQARIGADSDPGNLGGAQDPLLHRPADQVKDRPHSLFGMDPIPGGRRADQRLFDLSDNPGASIEDRQASKFTGKFDAQQDAQQFSNRLRRSCRR